jgi:hypothetical protein
MILQPTPIEVRAMLGDLLVAWEDISGVASCLGCGFMTARGWLEGRRYPSATAIRAIWVMWAMTCRPEVLGSQFDVITWGRFRNSPIIPAGQVPQESKRVPVVGKVARYVHHGQCTPTKARAA